MPRGMQRAKAGEWSTDAGRALEQPAPTVPAPAPVTEAKAKPRKFTALLDADTDARFGQLLTALRETVGPVATREDGSGRVRAGYDCSRADLLRALLVVAEDDPTVSAAVFAQVRAHYHRPDAATS